MSEWWTYSLSNFLMFSPQTYRRLFELYNQAVWPGHVAAIMAGILVLVLLWRQRGRAAVLLLVACWAWVAWGFHYSRYASINTAAPYFTVAFAVQAALLLAFAVASVHLRRAPAGLALVAFAVALQPLAGPLLAGRGWSQIEVFGLAPDPTAVATLGLAMCVTGAVRWLLFVIPALWCLVSAATLWTMGAVEAPMPVAAAVLALVVMFAQGWRGANARG